MKKAWKVLLTLLVALTLFAGVTACGNQEDTTQAGQSSTVDQTSTEEGDPDYNVEEDLVEGILTEDMLDEMVEEEATTEEKKEEDKKKEEEDKKKEEDKEKDPFANLKKYYVKVNRKTNVVTVYTYDENGKYTKPVRAFVCSVGKSSSPTPAGKFKISSKHRWQLMKGDVYSQYCSRITGHILFHSVPYRETKSDTLFSGYYDRLGSAASSGCVRLTCGDALWIYNNCSSGTTVEIFDGSSKDDPLGKPSAMKLSGTAYKNWDPTDPVSNNPWKTAKPIIKADSFTIELGSGKVDLASKATVTDAYGKKINPEISGNVDTNKAGTYSITYSAKDSRGNSAKKTITVTVADTKGPEITNSLNGTKYTGERTEAAVKAFIKEKTTVKDVSGTASISSIKVSIDENAGKIECTITAVDGAKNTSTMKFTMTFEVKAPDQDTSTGDTTTEDTSKEDTTTEDTSKEDTTTEDTSKEDTTTEDTSKEDTTTEDTSKEDTSSENNTDAQDEVSGQSEDEESEDADSQTKE